MSRMDRPDKYLHRARRIRHQFRIPGSNKAYLPGSGPSLNIDPGGRCTQNSDLFDWKDWKQEKMSVLCGGRVDEPHRRVLAYSVSPASLPSHLA